MTLMQRQPRQEDAAYLAFVRTLPCLVCQRPGPNDPAHIRAAAPQYGKRQTGFGEKPADKWVLPLCRTHHDAQHRDSELGWWAGMGIPDPFAVAIALYASRPGADRPRAERRPIAKPVKPRKPAAERRPMPKGKRLESGSTFPPGRKIANRNNLRKEPRP
jgi:hypothetical protein